MRRRTSLTTTFAVVSLVAMLALGRRPGDHGRPDDAPAGPRRGGAHRHGVRRQRPAQPRHRGRVAQGAVQAGHARPASRSTSSPTRRCSPSGCGASRGRVLFDTDGTTRRIPRHRPALQGHLGRPPLGRARDRGGGRRGRRRPVATPGCTAGSQTVLDVYVPGASPTPTPTCRTAPPRSCSTTRPPQAATADAVRNVAIIVGARSAGAVAAAVPHGAQRQPSAARLGGRERAPGPARPAHRPAQPASARRAPRARGHRREGRGAPRRAAAARHRPVQGDQRLARPRPRRHAARRGRGPASRDRARDRHGGSPRR